VEVSHELPAERVLRHGCRRLHRSPGRNVRDAQQRAAVHRHLGPNSQSILRFNEAAHGDFWFEADIELLTDPSARKHIGLWMTTGNGSEGYRFAHLDGAGVTLEQRLR
jgi:hypothetical protein